jgi:hypothetical protein
MERVKPFENLDDFAPKKAPVKPVEPTQIDQLARESGFPSRQPQTAPAVQTAAPVPVASRPRRRYITGRNQQLNIKATSETVNRFYRLADERNVPLGELLEMALMALERAGRRSANLPDT